MAHLVNNLQLSRLVAYNRAGRTRRRYAAPLTSESAKKYSMNGYSLLSRIMGKIFIPYEESHGSVWVNVSDS